MFFTTAEKSDGGFFTSWRPVLLAFDVSRRYLYCSAPLSSSGPHPTSVSHVRWKKNMKLRQAVFACTHLMVDFHEEWVKDKQYYEVEAIGERRPLKAKHDTPPPEPLLCPSTGLQPIPGRFSLDNEEFIQDPFFLRELHEGLVNTFVNLRLAREASGALHGTTPTVSTPTSASSPVASPTSRAAFHTLDSPTSAASRSTTTLSGPTPTTGSPIVQGSPISDTDKIDLLRFANAYDYQRFTFVVQWVLGFDKLMPPPHGGYPPYDPRNGVVLAPVPLYLWRWFHAWERQAVYFCGAGDLLRQMTPQVEGVRGGHLCLLERRVYLLYAKSGNTKPVPHAALHLHQIRLVLYTGESCGNPCVALLGEDGDLIFMPRPQTIGKTQTSMFPAGSLGLTAVMDSRMPPAPATDSITRLWATREVLQIVSVIQKVSLSSIETHPVIPIECLDVRSIGKFAAAIEARIGRKPCVQFGKCAFHEEKPLHDIWTEFRFSVRELRAMSSASTQQPGIPAVPIYENHTNNVPLTAEQLRNLRAVTDTRGPRHHRRHQARGEFTDAGGIVGFSLEAIPDSQARGAAQRSRSPPCPSSSCSEESLPSFAATSLTHPPAPLRSTRPLTRLPNGRHIHTHTHKQDDEGPATGRASGALSSPLCAAGHMVPWSAPRRWSDAACLEVASLRCHWLHIYFYIPTAIVTQRICIERLAASLEPLETYSSCLLCLCFSLSLFALQRGAAPLSLDLRDFFAVERFGALVLFTISFTYSPLTGLFLRLPNTMSSDGLFESWKPAVVGFDCTRRYLYCSAPLKNAGDRPCPSRLQWVKKMKLSRFRTLSLERFEDPTHTNSKEEQLYEVDFPPPEPLLCPSTGLQPIPGRFSLGNEEFIQDPFFLNELYEGLLDTFTNLLMAREASTSVAGSSRQSDFSTLDSPGRDAKARTFSIDLFKETDELFRFTNAYDYRRLMYVMQWVLSFDKLVPSPHGGYPPYDPRNGVVLAPVPLYLWRWFHAWERQAVYFCGAGDLLRQMTPQVEGVRGGHLCLLERRVYLLYAKSGNTKPVPHAALHLHQIRLVLYTGESCGNPCVALLGEDGDLIFMPRPQTIGKTQTSMFPAGSLGLTAVMDSRMPPAPATDSITRLWATREVLQIVSVIQKVSLSSIETHPVIPIECLDVRSIGKFAAAIEARIGRKPCVQFGKCAFHEEKPLDDIWRSCRHRMRELRRAPNASTQQPGIPAVPIYENHTNNVPLTAEQLRNLRAVTDTRGPRHHRRHQARGEFTDAGGIVGFSLEAIPDSQARGAAQRSRSPPCPSSSCSEESLPSFWKISYGVEQLFVLYPFLSLFFFFERIFSLFLFWFLLHFICPVLFDLLERCCTALVSLERLLRCGTLFLRLPNTVSSSPDPMRGAVRILEARGGCMKLSRSTPFAGHEAKHNTKATTEEQLYAVDVIGTKRGLAKNEFPPPEPLLCPSTGLQPIPGRFSLGNEEFIQDPFFLNELYEGLLDTFTNLLMAREASTSVAGSSRQSDFSTLDSPGRDAKARTFSIDLFKETDELFRFTNAYDYRRLMYVMQWVLSFDKLVPSPHGGYPPYDPRNGVVLAPVPLYLWRWFHAWERQAVYFCGAGDLLRQMTPQVEGVRGGHLCLLERRVYLLYAKSGNTKPVPHAALHLHQIRLVLYTGESCGNPCVALLGEDGDLIFMPRPQTIGKTQTSMFPAGSLGLTAVMDSRMPPAPATDSITRLWATREVLQIVSCLDVRSIGKFAAAIEARIGRKPCVQFGKCAFHEEKPLDDIWRSCRHRMRELRRAPNASTQQPGIPAVPIYENHTNNVPLTAEQLRNLRAVTDTRGPRHHRRHQARGEFTDAGGIVGFSLEAIPDSQARGAAQRSRSPPCPSSSCSEESLPSFWKISYGVEQLFVLYPFLSLFFFFERIFSLFLFWFLLHFICPVLFDLLERCCTALVSLERLLRCGTLFLRLPNTVSSSPDPRSALNVLLCRGDELWGAVRILDPRGGCTLPFEITPNSTPEATTEEQLYAVSVIGTKRGLAKNEFPPPEPLLCPSTGLQPIPGRFSLGNEEFIQDPFFLNELYEGLLDTFTNLLMAREASTSVAGSSRQSDFSTLDSPGRDAKARTFSIDLFKETDELFRFTNAYDYRRLMYVMQWVLSFDKLVPSPHGGYPPYDPRNGVVLAPVPLYLWRWFHAWERQAVYFCGAGDLLRQMTPQVEGVRGGHLCLLERRVYLLYAKSGNTKPVPHAALHLHQIRLVLYTGESCGNPCVALLGEDGDLIFMPRPQTIGKTQTSMFPAGSLGLTAVMDSRMPPAPATDSITRLWATREVLQIVSVIQKVSLSSIETHPVIPIECLDVRSIGKFAAAIEARIGRKPCVQFGKCAFHEEKPLDDIWRSCRHRMRELRRAPNASTQQPGIPAVPIYENHTNNVPLTAEQLRNLRAVTDTRGPRHHRRHQARGEFTDAGGIVGFSLEAIPDSQARGAAQRSRSPPVPHYGVEQLFVLYPFLSIFSLFLFLFLLHFICPVLFDLLERCCTALVSLERLLRCGTVRRTCFVFHFFYLLTLGLLETLERLS
eukprot:gene1671-1036_t